MRKLLLFCLPVILMVLSSFEPIQILNYTNGQKHFEYTSSNGMLTGRFISYYENGNKMIEGNFNNNQKTGDWNVWNENGTLMAGRSYKNNYCYAEGDLLLNNTNPKEYNFLLPGVILQPFSPLNPKDILLEKQIWRTIDNKNMNMILFQEQTIYKALVNALNSGRLTAYTNDDLNVPMSGSQASALNESTVSALNLKEEFVFDAQRQIGEYRILAIAPVGEIGGKHQVICWFKYSDIREILSTVAVKNSALPSFVQNAEQIFFYRYFGSLIYKESNIYNRQLSDYCKPEEMNVESIRIELSLIENECRLWSRPGNK